mmetsp:Transcript_9423/g.27843  ORF Transcript_9423/g.27843 Transcript_9423/m.27843 type:complete len:97 (+) Transcript_9423:513-803(+)
MLHRLFLRIRLCLVSARCRYMTFSAQMAQGIEAAHSTQRKHHRSEDEHDAKHKLHPSSCVHRLLGTIAMRMEPVNVYISHRNWRNQQDLWPGSPSS